LKCSFSIVFKLSFSHTAYFKESDLTDFNKELIKSCTIISYWWSSQANRTLDFRLSRTDRSDTI